MYSFLKIQFQVNSAPTFDNLDSPEGGLCIHEKMLYNWN